MASTFYEFIFPWAMANMGGNQEAILGWFGKQSFDDPLSELMQLR